MSAPLEFDEIVMTKSEVEVGQYYYYWKKLTTHDRS